MPIIILMMKMKINQKMRVDHSPLSIHYSNLKEFMKLVIMQECEET